MKGQDCCIFGHSASHMITFGVHPEIFTHLGKSVAVIKEKFCFCQEHWLHCSADCLRIIAEVCRKNVEELSHSSELEKGKGCWITLSALSNSGNFQLSYEDFENIYLQFVRTLRQT